MIFHLNILTIYGLIMNEKKIAAEYSVNYIEDGMIVGLGTGSTVEYMIHKLSERVKAGLNITAVSTSAATTKLATSLGIKISMLSEIDEIDLTIDGADEVDENLNGIKGGGGALLYEKIIAANSKKNIWIVDSSKLVKKLGKFPLPVEVVQFGSTHLCVKLESQGYKPTFRLTGSMRFITDNNNYLVDLRVEKIDDPVGLDTKLKKFAGVVETGLFYNIADIVIAGIGNKVEVINKKKRDQT
jgi:ribose 5-phosphate isomerase A